MDRLSFEDLLATRPSPGRALVVAMVVAESAAPLNQRITPRTRCAISSCSALSSRPFGP